jgi:hypothetical protein
LHACHGTNVTDLKKKEDSLSFSFHLILGGIAIDSKKIIVEINELFINQFEILIMMIFPGFCVQSDCFSTHASALLRKVIGF